jgi:hypothetical protein
MPSSKRSDLIISNIKSGPGDYNIATNEVKILFS